MMKNHNANTLVVRKIGETNRDSTYALLCRIVYMLGVEDKWSMKTSPLELVYKPTKQKIVFRGLDNPQKLSSITVTHGVLCWMWIEEAYQIDKEEDFDLVDQSIRGQMPDGLFPRIMVTFNPWHREHWLKAKFFDTPRADTLAMTTDYTMNEFISDRDRDYFEDLKVRNPKLYQVAGLGDWGVSEGLIYTDWEERDFDLNQILARKSVVALYGMDFGFTDPTAFVAFAVDTKTRQIYVFDEWYAHGVTSIDISDKIKEMGYQSERIVCDSENPQLIYELQKQGLSGATYAIKTKGSVEYGIQKCQQYHVVILPKCVNFLLEISMYAYAQDAHGKILDKPAHDFSHGMDAWRYALSELLYRSGQREGIVVGPSTDSASEKYRAKYGYEDVPLDNPNEKYHFDNEDEEDEDSGESKYVF